jgi:hypothetical protein
MSFFKDDGGRASVKLTYQPTPRAGVQQEIHWTDYNGLQDIFQAYAEAHELGMMDMINLYQTVAFFCDDERAKYLQTIEAMGNDLRVLFGKGKVTRYVDLSVGVPITMGEILGRSQVRFIKEFEHLCDAEDAIREFLSQ